MYLLHFIICIHGGTPKDTKMRVIRIDPKPSTVSFYTLRDRDGRVERTDIAASLGCEWVQYVQLASHVVLIIDEEGLRKYNHHWCFDNMQNFAGPGLVCGYDPETDDLMSLPDTTETSEFMAHIYWLGDDQGLEKNIKRGLVKRPNQRLITPDGKEQILWEWSPHEPDRPNYRH